MLSRLRPRKRESPTVPPASSNKRKRHSTTISSNANTSLICEHNVVCSAKGSVHSTETDIEDNEKKLMSGAREKLSIKISSEQITSPKLKVKETLVSKRHESVHTTPAIITDQKQLSDKEETVEQKEHHMKLRRTEKPAADTCMGKRVDNEKSRSEPLSLHTGQKRRIGTTKISSEQANIQKSPKHEVKKQHLTSESIITNQEQQLQSVKVSAASNEHESLRIGQGGKKHHTSISSKQKRDIHTSTRCEEKQLPSSDTCKTQRDCLERDTSEQTCYHITLNLEEKKQKLVLNEDESIDSIRIIPPNQQQHSNEYSIAASMASKVMSVHTSNLEDKQRLTNRQAKLHGSPKHTEEIEKLVAGEESVYISLTSEDSHEPIFSGSQSVLNTSPKQDEQTNEVCSTQQSVLSCQTSKKTRSTSQPTKALLEDESQHSHIHQSGTEVNENRGYTAMLKCNHKLVTALSTDYLNIATVLLAEGLIPEEINDKMLTPSSTPKEKAAILVSAIRNKIKVAPQRFQDLIKIFCEEISTKDVYKMLQSAYQGTIDSISRIPINFVDYFKEVYATLIPTHTSKNRDHWPPSATRKVYRLAMIANERIRRGQIDERQVRMQMLGEVESTLRYKREVKLESIISETHGERKVVLFEGAPGSGKSTLSIHITQQVSAGKMFMEFQLAILIQLRDPAIQNAQCIADLLPGRDKMMSQQVADTICSTDGEGVLFILDGWDELPPPLRTQSLFRDLIQPNSHPSCKIRLHKTGVIITSRPIASGDLHQLVSSRVEILGFTPEELKAYFGECLEDDMTAVQSLLERINDNPVVAGSCYLPLNASILAHLFKCANNTLPTTQYGIFSELVLSCIYRHQNERTQHRNLSLDSLEHLPEVVRSPFLYLCQVAYQGIMDDCVIFTDLPDDVNTLGLLQGVESFVRRGKSLSYNFIHLSIQEILGGLYIATQLPASEQVSKFNDLFDKSRFSAVFQMYSAITKLQTPGINDIITRIATKCGVEWQDEQVKTLLLSLLHCLYESQEPSLCECVAQHLQHGLNLRYITLTPFDCLCVGFFLSNVCKTTAGEFKVNLAMCSIDDQGCKYLANGLHKCLDTHSTATTTLSIDLYGNDISALSELLKTDCINELNLTFNSISDEGACIIAENLKNNTSVKVLKMVGCDFKSKGVECLATALTTNNSLEVLYCDEAPCDDVIDKLAHALTVNHSLKILHLSNCGLTDKSLESLAKSLQQNRSLENLNICNGFQYDGGGSINYPNTITAEGVSVLSECLKNNSLLELLLPVEFKSSRATVEDAINESRKRSGLPLIKVTVDGDTVQECIERMQTMKAWRK